MKKETAKKNKLWLWIGLGVVALLAVVGIVLALVLGGGQGSSGGRADLYWNVDRVAFTKDSESGLSTRTAAADGMYYVKFAYNGEQVELPVADKRLINFIDTMDLMGLVIDKDGIVVDAVAPTDLAVEKGKGIYFVEAKDGNVIANSAITLNGLAMEFAVTENTQIYNVSSSATTVGEIIQAGDIQLMDTIHVYANDLEEITHIYLAESPLQSEIYWRMDQFYNSTLKETSREPDENGVYHIPYWCEGEEVDIKIKDRKLVTEIDSRSFYWPHSSFRFDEEGYAVARINTGTATRTIAQVDCYDVMEIDGNNISTQPFGNGTPYNFKVTEETRIYDVSNLAKALGTAGQRVDSLKINDRVSVWTDKDNNAVLIYIASRRAESPIYYNVKRQWDSTEMTTKRTPNADGLYEIDLWTEEEGTKTYLMNLDQVNMVDGEDYRICGIKADGKLVQEVYPLESLFGYPAVCNGRWVTDITGSIFTIISPANFTSTNWVMTADCKIIDVSDTNNPKPTTLRVGDNVRVFRNPPGEVVCIFVCARQAGGDTLYYNLDRQYDDTKKVTKRLPDENGWYVFDVAHNGKVEQVKTRDKELANTVESYNPGAVVLIVKNGIIQKAADPNTAYCGKKVASAYYFEGYDKDGKAIFSFEGRDNQVHELAEDLEVFDVSTNSFRNRGAKTTLRENDWVTCFTDMYGKLRVVFVRSRTADCAAFNFQRMYDTKTASTTRVPDADGWYVYQMAIDGKCKTLKTKDKKLASEIDYQSTNAIGLVLKGDVITGYTLARSIPGISANGTRGYDIVKISGRTLTLRYTMPGSVNTDKEQTITIASNAKVYDVSTGDIATFGKKINFSSLKVGDRITTMRDADNNHALVYVTHRGGHTAYCDHCDKEVYWYPWAMDGYNVADSHFYLYRDVDVTKLLSLENADKNYTLVIDLAGHTWTRTNNIRAIKVAEGESLYLMDSVGGGKICTTGSNGINGGVVQVATGGKFYLMGGTLEQLHDDSILIPNGGVVNMSGESEFHMSGGKLLNGAANLGGALYTSNGIVDITGGVIEGGSADMSGGNIYFYGATSVNMENVTVIGGNAKKHGGNIFFSDSVKEFTIKNCKIVDGVAGDKGGNIYINGHTAVDANVNLINCTISGGKAGVFGNNIYHNKGTLTLAGGAMENGDLMTNTGAKLVMTGDYKADTLNLVAGSTVDLSKWTPSTAMKVNAEGVFTTELSNLDAIKAYIQVGTEGAELKTEGKKLSMTGAVLPEEPPIDITDPTICPHCGEKWETITWSAWTGEHDPVSGHYKLEKDMTTAHTNIASKKNLDAEILLDLNGHILKGNDGDYVMGVGLTDGSEIKLTIIDSVGGGEIQATGKTDGVGVLMMQNGSVLNLFGGTLRRLPSDSAIPAWGTLYVMNAKVNMYGGKICDGYTTATADASAGNVMLRGTSLMNMYGGEISNGFAAKNSGGVHVYGTNPVFNMYGGVIKDNKTNGAGANVYVSGSTATIGGTAEIYGGLKGDKVNNITVTGTLTINGGTIDGGVTGSFKALTLGGNPVIKANTIGLEIAEGKKVTLGDLTEGAEIWVNAKGGVFTTENAKAADYATYFKTNIEGASIEAQGNALAIAGIGGTEPEQPPVGPGEPTDEAVCPHCGVKVSEITWKTWTATADPASGHYKLEDDLTTTWHINIGSSQNLNADIVLDLNGKTWKSDGGYVMGIGTNASSSIKFSIMDSVGGGEIQGTGTNEADYNNSAVLTLLNGAELNIYGGTLRQIRTEGVNLAIAGVLYAKDSTVNMYGGKICDGYTTAEPSNGVIGGNVVMRGTTSVLNMYGGEITGGYAKKYGGGVTILGTFNMSGGSIYDNEVYYAHGANVMVCASGTANISGTAKIYGGVGKNGTSNIGCTGKLNISGGEIDGGITDNFKSVTVSGAPVIKANGVGLAIPEGKTITLGELTDGANIWVNAKGVFTAGNENAAEYKKYFHTNVEGVCVDVENNTLVIKEGENSDLHPAVLCPHCGVDVETITWNAWTGAEDPASGHYRLEADLQTDHTNIGRLANNDADIVLDLNGHTWKSNNGDYLLSLGVAANSTVDFSIIDTVGGGELQATGMKNDVGVVGVKNGATLNIYGGTIRQLYSKDAIPALGALYAMHSTVNMSGGKITDGYTTSTAAASAGNVMVRGTTVFTMTGGEITNGHAVKYGGGVVVYSNDSHFIMEGGKIYNNVADGNGGNVYVSTGSATFSKDAEIYNGVAGGKGNNIYFGGANGTVTLDGVTKIDGDIVADRNVIIKGKVNIPMGNSNGIFIGTAGKKLDVTNMASDSTVYFGAAVAANATAEITTGGGAAKIACFKPVGRTTSVEVKGTALQAGRAGDTAAQQSWCPHCDQYVTWYRSSGMTTSGILDTYSHFFFNDGLSYTIDTAGAEIVFDMCGKNISGTRQIFVLNGANTKLSILDSVGNGQIVGKGATSGTTSASNGGVINVSGSSTNATITIFSGKLALHETPNAFVLRGGVIAMNSGVLNIKGGIIANGKTTVDNAGGSGGNIYLQNTVLNMTGGLVTGGTARLNGGNIYLNSNAYANITGGMIENGTATNQQGGNIVSNYSGTEANTIANVVLRGGTAGTFGGNLSFSAPAKFTVNNVVLAGGNAANGGNLSVGGKLTEADGVSSCEVTAADCLIYGGTASAADNDVHVATGANYNN